MQNMTEFFKKITFRYEKYLVCVQYIFYQKLVSVNFQKP